MSEVLLIVYFWKVIAEFFLINFQVSLLFHAP